MKSKADSRIKNKLQNITDSFKISKDNDGKPTGAKLIKKLAIESLNSPPKMREIDLEKHGSVNRDILNMIDDMVSKERVITRHYDISTILVDQNPDPKIIDTNMRQDEIATTTPKSPTLPKPRINMINKVQRGAKIEEKIHKKTKINDKSLTDNKNPETEVRNSKIHDEETNMRESLIFTENLSTFKNNKKRNDEKYDLDVLDLDYSEIDIEPTIHDDTSVKSNNNLRIDENDDVICSDSVENTSRSSRKKVTSTSNDIGVPNNDNSFPNNDNSPPNHDVPPNNDESSPNNGNNVVDSTQCNSKPLDDDAFHYSVMMMKMFLAQLSISFNSIYNFM